MNRVVTSSSLPTTVDQLLTGTPALQAVMADAGSGHNQLWIRDLSFAQQRCRTEPSYRVGSLPI